MRSNGQAFKAPLQGIDAQRAPLQGSDAQRLPLQKDRQSETAATDTTQEISACCCSGWSPTAECIWFRQSETATTGRKSLRIFFSLRNISTCDWQKFFTAVHLIP